jgi:hypothetical protein
MLALVLQQEQILRVQSQSDLTKDDKFALPDARFAG